LVVAELVGLEELAALAADIDSSTPYAFDAPKA
jgi:hypothetical protein